MVCSDVSTSTIYLDAMTPFETSTCDAQIGANPKVRFSKPR